MIYNSPYYGYETRADLFFSLRQRHPHLVGFKEFGGAVSLRYAAEHITGKDPALTLMVGVDTQVFHGFVNCGATGAITGIGNVLPREVLHLVDLCQQGGARRCNRASPRRRAGTGARRSVVFRRRRRPCSLLQISDDAEGRH